MTTRPAPPRAVWTALAVVYVVWGSTYLAIRYLVETFPPFIGAGARYLVAGIVLAAILAVARGPAVLKIRPRSLAATTLVGALLLVGGNGGVVYAEQTVRSGLAALVVAAVPLFVVVLRLLTRDRPPAATLVGVLIGFIGLAVLVHPTGHVGSGVLIVLAASLSWSVGSFFSGRLPLPTDAFASTTYEMLTGGALLLALSAVRGEWGHFSVGQVSAASWWALVYLVILGSVVAFSAYVWVLTAAPISTVSTYAYVNPAVAVLLGTLAGEPLTRTLVVGGLIVIVAVAVVVTTEGRARPRQPAGDALAPEPGGSSTPTCCAAPRPGGEEPRAPTTGG